MDAKPINDKVLELTYADKDAEAILLYIDRGIKEMGKVHQAVVAFKNWQDDQFNSMENKSDALNKSIIVIYVICIILILSIAISFSFFITKSIANPIKSMLVNINNVAQGDVSKQVSSELCERNDEIGTLAKGLQKVVMYLRKMITDLDEGVKTVSSSSTELSTISTQLNSHAKETNERMSTAKSPGHDIQLAQDTEWQSPTNCLVTITLTKRIYYGILNLGTCV
jgi:methyl-accepting chemotaxis protein